MNTYTIGCNNYGRWYVQERISATLSRIVKSDLTYTQAVKLAARLNVHA